MGRTHITRMRNSTRRTGAPNTGSGEEGQMVHKKRCAHPKALKSIRKIRKNDGQNK